MGSERNVAVVGWGQVTQPKKIEGKIKSPLELMIEASVKAAAVSSPEMWLNDLDAIMVVKTLSRHYDAPQKDLAAYFNAAPKTMMVSGIGGNSPQTLINKAAGLIARGEIETALITGAECYVRREPDAVRVENALFSGVPDDYQGDDRIGALDIEIRHGMEQPMHGFPLYETALWAESGMDLASYLNKIGSMWASFSRIAADHPFSWTKKPRPAAQIITPAPDNRPVAFPYTKYMNSFVTVDQGAAIILASEEKSAAFRSKTLRPVYFVGGGYARDRQRFMVEKTDFTACPSLKAAAEKALYRSRIPLDRLDCFDLYSCFPSAVTIAKKMIGISDEDPRPLTLTGGLGFFGGPGNNYSLHSAATLVDHIAKGRAANGMITALGWFMHKHAAGIYAAAPTGSQIGGDDLEDQAEPYAGQHPEQVDETPDGTGVVQTYTVIYSKDARPSYGLVYGKTHGGRRFVARTQDDQRVFSHITQQNMIGKKVRLSHDPRTRMNTAVFI